MTMAAFEISPYLVAEIERGNFVLMLTGLINYS